MNHHMHFLRHARHGGHHPGFGAGPHAGHHGHGRGRGPGGGFGRGDDHDHGHGRPGPGHGGPGFGRGRFGGRGEHPGFGREGGHGRGRGPGGGFGRGPEFGRPPFGPWGDPGERRERLERGFLRYLLLDALREQPKHGYEIIKNLEERTSGRYVPSPGTVYPTLQLLEDQGLVADEQQDARRVYRLTEAGQAELAARADTVAGFWSRFQADPAAPGQGHEAAFLRDELGDLMRTVRHVATGADEATLRAVREVIERCERDIRDLVAGRDATPATPPAEPR